MAELTLNVRDIDDVGKDYVFTLSAEWMTRELADCQLRAAGEAGELSLHVQLNDNDVLINGHLRADLVAECSRCLADVPCAVDMDVIALLSPMPDSRHGNDNEELELTEEDTYRAHYSGTQIVLDELIREHLVLEVPMQPLCSADCKGIAVPDHVRPPPEIFESAPVDPRLAPLMKFKDKVPRNKE